jgi:hypothetical protein
VQVPNDKPMCWKYDKRGVPHLKSHKWKQADTPDRWDWEVCSGCGQYRRVKQGRIV